ncbi:hypothetical protein E2C01_021641 [Portunus trituberculatus]|uniref:Uncharacterized protein n=1 Tax=Portunus trituberculatus TaxID=210409 RepID=A0A5B7E538_PORTR|nr:hypothetical protein [Portunus trituberculatus]
MGKTGWVTSRRPRRVAVFGVLVSRPWRRSGCAHGCCSTMSVESQFQRIPMGRHTPHSIHGSVVLKESCKYMSYDGDSFLRYVSPLMSGEG